MTDQPTSARLNERATGEKMPEVKRQNERLIATLLLGIIALNYPLIALFSRKELFLGIPVLYLYIFTVWALFVLCVALIHERTTSDHLTS